MLPISYNSFQCVKYHWQTILWKSAQKGNNRKNKQTKWRLDKARYNSSYIEDYFLLLTNLSDAKISSKMRNWFMLSETWKFHFFTFYILSIKLYLRYTFFSWNRLSACSYIRIEHLWSSSILSNSVGNKLKGLRTYKNEKDQRWRG